MPTHQLLRGTGLAVAACTALAFLSGCGGESAPSNSAPPNNSAPSNDSAPPSNSGTFFGPSQSLGNGTVKTYVTLDDGGQPTEVGLRLTATALDGLPNEHRPPADADARLPRSGGGDRFDHVMLNWNPQGHDPSPCSANRTSTSTSTWSTWRRSRPSARPTRTTPPRPNMRPRRNTCHRTTWFRRGARRCAGGTRHGRAPGRLQRHQPRPRRLRLRTDRHQRRLGRPLHVHRADDHPRMAADPTQPPSRRSSSPRHTRSPGTTRQRTPSTSTSRQRNMSSHSPA